MRKLRRKAPPECVREFMKIFKKYFDNAVKNKLQKPDSVAMQNALLLFNKKHKIKLSKDIVKNAAISELGDSRLVGKYLSDIVKFIMTRISSEKRAKSLYGLKLKIYNLNENEISNKNLPASSAIGQSITLIKHVLFQHNPQYIREVLNNIVRNL